MASSSSSLGEVKHGGRKTARLEKAMTQRIADRGTEVVNRFTPILLRIMLDKTYRDHLIIITENELHHKAYDRWFFLSIPPERASPTLLKMKDEFHSSSTSRGKYSLVFVQQMQYVSGVDYMSIVTFSNDVVVACLKSKPLPHELKLDPSGDYRFDIQDTDVTGCLRHSVLDATSTVPRSATIKVNARKNRVSVKRKGAQYPYKVILHSKEKGQVSQKSGKCFDLNDLEMIMKKECNVYMSEYKCFNRMCDLPCAGTRDVFQSSWDTPRTFTVDRYPTCGKECDKKIEHKKATTDIVSHMCTQCEMVQYGVKGERMLRCKGGCDDTRYCSKECQAKHWPIHKTTCPHTATTTTLTKITALSRPSTSPPTIDELD